jgi:predicted GIY-YIG superfamily endonuclease
MVYVYILACIETGRSYVGQTDDLLRRFRMHVEGSARTTREKLRRPVVVYWEAQPDRAKAMRRERYFKAGSGHRVKCELLAAGLKLFGQVG